ncbi:MAG: hypothetical protein ACWGOX_01950 [Desulforhopalus sp.]
MKPDSQVRFTIIGLGNLMEVIWHCFTNALGGSDLAVRAVATTADTGDVARKREFYRIPVQIEGNLAALKANRPDIIFFAPPPSVAPGEIDTTLKSYFAWAREQNLPLPEIYAFPPVPAGHYYREALGFDVLVVNIIPNNVYQIAGRPVVDEGYYACTFSTNWPAESTSRLQRIFASQGVMVEVPADKLVPMLGGTCTFFSLWQVVPVFTDILNDHGQQITHNQVGEYMRALCQEQSGFVPPRSDPASRSALSGPLLGLLQAVASAWWDGVAHYYADINFPEKASRTILARGFDIILHTTQFESRDALHDYAVGAATKGGVLEKAITTFHSLIKPVLENGAVNPGLATSSQWRTDLAARVTETAHIVGRHGQLLAG